MKKNILVVGMSSNLGGVECFIMNYFRNLDTNRIHIDFLIYEDHCVFEDEIKQRGSIIYRIKESRYKNAMNFVRKRNNLFRNIASKYDCFWLNDCSLANACDLRAAQKLGFKRRIFHSHNSRHMRNDVKRYFYVVIHQINKLFIKNWATDYWACSIDAGKFCFNNRIVNNSKFKIIPNAIEMNKYFYDENTRLKYRKKFQVKDQIVIGCIGRLHFQKNQMFLLDIYIKLLEKVPNAVLWIIGEGEDRKVIESKIKINLLSEKIKMFGVRNDIPELMQAMDLFVLPSVFEGLGIVLVEAQAAGLRTFASETVIPQCVKITDLLNFVPLKNNPQKWADMIENALYYSRKSMKNELNGSIYNITFAIAQLEELLCDY